MDASCQSTATKGVIMKHPTIEQLLIACIDPSSHDDVYVDRVMQSLPLSPEIFSRQLRIVNDQQQKKGSFMLKLRTLPLPLLALVIAGSVLLLGGTAYAAYTYLWKPAHINVGSQTKGSDGHTRTVVALTDCALIPQDRMTIETKRNVNLDPVAIKSRVQAQCELNAIEVYMSSLPQSGDPTLEGYAMQPCIMKMPDHIGTTIQTPACSVIPTRDYMIDSKTKYIKNGIEVDARAIKPGSTITVLAYDYSEYDAVSTRIVTTHRRAAAIIELSLPVDDYMYVGGSIAYRIECLNNTSETCLSYIASAGVYMRTDLPDGVRIAQYEGRVTNIHNDTVTLKTSSNRIVNLTMPAGTLAQYAANSRDRLSVSVGDMMQLMAVTPANSNKSDFQPTDISYVLLVTDIDAKTRVVSKY